MDEEKMKLVYKIDNAIDSAVTYLAVGFGIIGGSTVLALECVSNRDYVGAFVAAASGIIGGYISGKSSKNLCANQKALKDIALGGLETKVEGQ
ncbi:MAG: hypothetical protein PHO02_03055 [Candidatus Nanoarchaeia archaeon]|nr:hypothetical protein [Candidatus Nanoarchaeia archaeon]